MSAVKKELEKCGCTVVEHLIVGSEIVHGRFVVEELFPELHACQAIIFGSPTYMGGVSAQFKAFADATSEFWQQQKWAGKLAAGVTSGTGLNGDQGATLAYLQLLASQHGMLWVSLDAPFNDENKGVNRLGCHLGVTAHSKDGSVHNADIKSAKYLARRVFNLATRLKNESD
ncbi:MAG: flavodoxin family protein [Aestuariibacter sp.]